MESSVPLPDGTRLVTRQHVEVIHSMFDYHTERDSNWTYTDKGLHFHMAVKTVDNVVYPTCRLMCDDYWCDDCRDIHEDSHLECRYCGEEIRPGTIRVPNEPLAWTGPQEWTREGWIRVTYEEAQEMLNAKEVTAMRSAVFSGVEVEIHEDITTQERKDELMAQAKAYSEAGRPRWKR
jgi:hypothetical protein